jgi:predicted RNase H-like HicB family nuclease
MADHFTYRVSWSEEDREYVGSCAEFPSLSHLSPSRSAALRGIEKLVRDVTADMKKQGEPIPSPLAAQPFSGKFMTRIPPELHRQLAIEAAEAGISLNRLVSFKLALPIAPIGGRPSLSDANVDRPNRSSPHRKRTAA